MLTVQFLDSTSPRVACGLGGKKGKGKKEGDRTDAVEDHHETAVVASLCSVLTPQRERHGRAPRCVRCFFFLLP